MALTANREVDHYVDQELRALPVAASAHVFKGALVGLTAGGYARPLLAGDPLAGIAYEEIDNSGEAAGAQSLRVYTLGDFGFLLAGATVASIGRPVFASSDDTLTFTGGGNSFVGFAQDVPASGEIILRLSPMTCPIKTATHVVENLSAGADFSARAMHAFDQDAWVVSARVVNQGSAAAGINAGNTCVVAVVSGAGTVAQVTYDGTTTFPAVNTSGDMGAITNAHAAKGTVLTLAVTNGAAADPGPFIVEVDYV